MNGLGTVNACQVLPVQVQNHFFIDLCAPGHCDIETDKELPEATAAAKLDADCCLKYHCALRLSLKGSHSKPVFKNIPRVQ